MGGRSRIAAVLVALLLLPLLSVPLYLLGNWIVQELDDDPSNGAFALQLFLGIGGPGLLAILVAYRKVGIPLAVVLGIASGFVSAGVLLVTFVIYCDATDCIV
jgi:uncharacterized membrane protein YphA (DoxX/SURF4 family)